MKCWIELIFIVSTTTTTHTGDRSSARAHLIRRRSNVCIFCLSSTLSVVKSKPLTIHEKNEEKNWKTYFFGAISRRRSSRHIWLLREEILSTSLDGGVSCVICNCVVSMRNELKPAMNYDCDDIQIRLLAFLLGRIRKSSEVAKLATFFSHFLFSCELGKTLNWV